MTVLLLCDERSKKPFERLWISSMEDDAIRDGFAHLKNGTEYDALYEAALCRERADWMVGINATRLFSCLYGQTLNVGRVMTPTLAMVVMRDAVQTAANFGKREDHAVNYHSDTKGTQLNYEVLGDAICKMRACGSLQENWREKIDEDFEERS